MRPNDKTEKIIKDFDIDVNADRDRDILLELQRVQAESGGANPGYSVIGVGRIFSKSIMAKMVVAAVTIAMLFCLYTATGPFFVSDAFADMRKAMAVMPIMHRNLYTTDKEGQKHHTENWYYFDSRTVLAKYSVDGECAKISCLDYNSMENVVFDPASESIKVSHRTDVFTDSLPASPWEEIESTLAIFKTTGSISTPENGQYEGSEVDIYKLATPKNERGEKVEAELIVDRHNHLPIVFKRKLWTPQNQLVFDQIIYYAFPETGPKDIYDLGVPLATTVNFDYESKNRLDRKRYLESMLPMWKQQLNESYYLEQNQVLKLIPPPLMGTRMKIEQATSEISQLIQPSNINLNDVQYHLLYWDEGIIDNNKPVFSKGVTLKMAFERIVGLSKFQYDIPENLTDINIPGDWIARKGATKDDLIRDLNDIVQDYTKRPIRFEKRQVERDVIVARGQFQFKPLSGTYDDSWVHVFSNKLDPDEGGGGGTSSLDKFLNQRLAVIQLNEQVVNLSEASDDVMLSYGTHYSGYLGKLPDGPEKTAKLEMLLENLTRQTSLSFTRERRLVDVWYVVEDK